MIIIHNLKTTTCHTDKQHIKTIRTVHLVPEEPFWPGNFCSRWVLARAVWTDSAVLMIQIVTLRGVWVREQTDVKFCPFAVLFLSRLALQRIQFRYKQVPWIFNKAGYISNTVKRIKSNDTYRYWDTWSICNECCTWGLSEIKAAVEKLPFPMALEVTHPL